MCDGLRRSHREGAMEGRWWMERIAATLEENGWASVRERKKKAESFFQYCTRPDDIS